MIKDKTPANSLFMSLDQVSILSEVTASSFDLEMERIVSLESRERVGTFFFKTYYEGRLYSFFNARELATLSEEIYRDGVLRDFVLNLTDRVGLLLSVSEFDIEKSIESTANGISLKLSERSDLSLIYSKLKAGIDVSKDYIRDLLKNNFWLLVFVYVYLFFPKTAFFQNANDNLKVRG